MNHPPENPRQSRLLPAHALLIAALAACKASMAIAAAPVHAEFQKDGASFIEKHCVECHGGKATKADLDLKKIDRSDVAILKNRKVWMNVLTQVGTGEMPPKKRPRPALEELEKFTRSVESAFERAEMSAPPDPGRVTIRRLNRNEYNNTVRDLLGVDFNPAEDFPPDDIGHGFDNIGDVLTVSPLLTERYLDAADAIARRVILPELPKPSRRYLSGKYLQPNNAQTPQGRFRELNPTSAEAVHSGPFTAAGDYLKFSADDDFFFRATLYATTKGTAPVKAALFLTGKNLTDVSSDAEIGQLMGANVQKLKPLKIVKIFEIKSREAGKLQTIEVPVNRMGSIANAGIALLKPADGEEPAHLFIENLWSEGPMDTRPASQRAILACSPNKPQPQQTREVLTRLLTRGYRRPATPAEIEAHAKFVDAAVAGGQKWEAGIQQVIQALLCSPKFLFRVELDQRPDAKRAGGQRAGTPGQPVSGNRVAHPLADRPQVTCIDRVERRRRVGIHVQHGADAAFAIQDRHHDLRAGRARTGDVKRHLRHVGDDLRRGFAGAFSADSLFERNREAAVTALIRADLQKPRLDDTIEPGPIEVLQSVMQFAGDGGHDGDPVLFALDQGADGSEDPLVLRRLGHGEKPCPGPACAVKRCAARFPGERPTSARAAVLRRAALVSLRRCRSSPAAVSRASGRPARRAASAISTGISFRDRPR